MRRGGALVLCFCGTGGDSGRGVARAVVGVTRPNGRGLRAPDLSEVWKRACQPVVLGAGVVQSWRTLPVVRLSGPPPTVA